LNFITHVLSDLLIFSLSTKKVESEPQPVIPYEIKREDLARHCWYPCQTPPYLIACDYLAQRVFWPT
jgi:hypothetical protein